MTEIKVKNPNLLKTIDYRKLQPLQGNLKDLTETNYNKLKNVLLNRGFTTPFYVWIEHDNYWLIDGHQRLRVMKQEDMNHHGSYEMPYILIEAKDKKDAKAQLLEITSQYGHMTYEGFDEFTDELETNQFEDVAFDALPLVAQNDDEPEPKVENNTIIVSFDDTLELGECLVDIQNIVKNYVSAKIIKPKEKYSE